MGVHHASEEAFSVNGVVGGCEVFGASQQGANKEENSVFHLKLLGKCYGAMPGVLGGLRICQAWRIESSRAPSILMQRPNPESIHYDDFVQFQKKLHGKIIGLRKAHGYSQEDMTEFELSLRQYQRMEQDPTSIVSIWQLFKMARAYDLDLKDLVDVE